MFWCVSRQGKTHMCYLHTCPSYDRLRGWKIKLEVSVRRHTGGWAVVSVWSMYMYVVWGVWYGSAQHKGSESMKPKKQELKRHRACALAGHHPWTLTKGIYQERRKIMHQGHSGHLHPHPVQLVGVLLLWVHDEDVRTTDVDEGVFRKKCTFFSVVVLVNQVGLQTQVFNLRYFERRLGWSTSVQKGLKPAFSSSSHHFKKNGKSRCQRWISSWSWPNGKGLLLWTYVFNNAVKVSNSQLSMSILSISMCLCPLIFIKLSSVYILCSSVGPWASVPARPYGLKCARDRSGGESWTSGPNLLTEKSYPQTWQPVVRVSNSASNEDSWLMPTE